MSQAVDFYIGLPSVKVAPPKNWEALKAELSFENNDPEAVINSQILEWEGATASTLNAWFNNGKIYEGIPLVIKICTTGEILFDGIIDLTFEETVWNCDKVKVKIRDRRMDMISQLFNSVSFAYLATPVSQGGAGIINPLPISQGGDYVVIPYQINSVPDYVQFFSMGLAVYNVADKTYDVLNKLIALVTGTTIDFSSAQVGGAILGILQIIGYIAYIVLMIVVIIDMLVAAFHYLVSPVFTKLGMYVNTLMTRACQYFNIPFYSTILQTDPYKRMVIMPSKPAWASNQTFTRELYNQFMSWTGSANRMQYDDLYNLQHGGFAYGYFDGTPGDLVRSLEDVFDARAKVIMNGAGQPELHFERWDYQYAVSSIVFPPISDQAPFPQAFSTNAAELAANYEVAYSLDTTDENTYHYYEGTRTMYQATPFPATIQNSVLRNYTQRQLIYAHAFRKDKETAVEEVLGKLWTISTHIANPIINVLNGITNIVNWVINLFCNHCQGLQPIPSLPAQPSWAATGHLLLSNNITGVPKIFLATTDNGTGTTNNWYGYQGVLIDPNNRSQTQPSLAADRLVKYFHFSSLALSVAPGAPYTTVPAGSPYFNQWKKYMGQRVPACCSDYTAIKSNNIVTLNDGTQAKVMSYKFNIRNGTADTDYWVRYKFAPNLQTTYIIDGVTSTTAL